MKRLLYNRPSSIRYFPTYKKIKPYTMVRFPALVQVVDLIKDLDRRDIEGSVVEAGCWRGGLTSFVAHHTDRKVIGIDKGDGLDEGGEKDGRVMKKYGGTVKGHLAIKDKTAPLPKNAERIEGNAIDAIPMLPDEIALLRIDVDMYDATKRVLEVAKEKLVSGAWVVLDDYDDFEGARRAVHEFLSQEKRFPKIRQYPYGGSFYFRWK